MVRKNNKLLIKRYFFTHPTTKLRARQIERATGASIPSVLRYVEELEQERILKQEEIANITVYSADRTSKQYRREKQLHNINRLHETGLTDHLIDTYHDAPIILFGSYAKGEDTEDSDIDLYVETPQSPEEIPETIEKALKRRVQLFCHETIDDVENTDLANNILNGTTLNGFVEAL